MLEVKEKLISLPGWPESLKEFRLKLMGKFLDEETTMKDVYVWDGKLFSIAFSKSSSGAAEPVKKGEEVV